MHFELAIFDLDGTILDTLEDLAISLNTALVAAGRPPRTMEEVRSFVGNGIHLLVERGLGADVPQELTDTVFSSFKAHYASHCEDHTKPYDGIVSLLAELKAKGVRIAVVSNKADFAVQKLCEQYFPGLIDLAIGEKEGFNKKPAPDMVELAIRALGKQKESVVYIGDSEVDIETARNAGLFCLAVSWGFRSEAELRRAGAEHIFHHIEELKAFLFQQ